MLKSTLIGEREPDTARRNGSEYRTLDEKWDSHVVTWSFAENNILGDWREADIGEPFLRDDSDGMRSLIRDAFDAWEAVCGIDFVEVSDGALVDIRIGWARIGSEHSDGPGGVLGTYSYLTGDDGSTMVSGRILIDWFDSGTSLAAIYDTVLHEIGHAVGLGHSDVENMVMSGGLGTEPDGLTPYWNGVPGRDPLQPDDIAGAVALWGEPVRSTGTPGPDTLLGGPGPDTLSGGEGDDVLVGGLGEDSLAGGPGEDRIWGQGGPDTIDGGAADDLLFGQAGADRIDGGAGADIVLGGTGEDRIDGGLGEDRLWGEGGLDTMEGGAGDDFVAGGAGDDSLTGGTGRDYLLGGEGADRLDGGAGYDILNGEAGDDTLRGGAEGDTFFGGPGADTFVLTGGTSWVMDFRLGEDVLQAPGLPGVATQGLPPGANPTADRAHVLIQYEGGTVFLAGVQMPPSYWDDDSRYTDPQGDIVWF